MPSLLWPFAATFALTVASIATADAGLVRFEQASVERSVSGADRAPGAVHLASANCEPGTAPQGEEAGSCVDLDSVVVEDIELSGAWARAMLPGQPAGGGYIAITNRGTQADRLVSASSARAGRVELHTMEIVDDVMTMRPVKDGVTIEPGQTVTFAPGGMHVMFLDVAEPFADGDSVPVTLEFEKAGRAEMSFEVHGRENAPADEAQGDDSGHGAAHRH